MPSLHALTIAEAICTQLAAAPDAKPTVAQLSPCIDACLRTPNASLPPLDPTAARRKMVITIEVAADFEKRLDNQWMVEREIAADRWTWQWPVEPTPSTPQ